MRGEVEHFNFHQRCQLVAKLGRNLKLHPNFLPGIYPKCVIYKYPNYPSALLCGAKQAAQRAYHDCASPPFGRLMFFSSKIPSKYWSLKSMASSTQRGRWSDSW